MGYKLRYLFYISFIFLQFCAYQGQNNSANSNDLYDNLELLSESISQKLESSSIEKIAIMDYSNSSDIHSNLGAYISDEITLQLFLKEKFQIIERDQLDYVISEQKLGSSGLIDNSSAIEIGNILSVDAIILGDISVIDNNISITTKAISAETSQILFIDRISIAKNQDFELVAEESNITNKDVSKNNDYFSSNNPKNYDTSIKKLGRKFLDCLKEKKYKCYSQFIASKDQFRKILLITHQKDKLARKRKVKDINLEYKLYKKRHKENFSNTIKRLKSRNINWNNVEIKKIDFKVVKNYDQKKLFNVSMRLHDGQKRIHIGFNAFKLNGQWIINDLDIKRKK